MEALKAVAARQAIWSSTANALKRTLDRTRWITFVLSGIAALLAAIASQIPGEHQHLRLSLAIASAVLLGAVSFVSSRLMTGSKVGDWTRARTASEALKREAYKCAARAAPYDDPASRDGRLNDEREKIEEDVDDLLGVVVPAVGAGSVPTVDLTPAEYRDKRVRGQIAWYNSKAEPYRRRAVFLRRMEFGLALVAAVITAADGVVGKTPFFGISFDFVALTAVLTTIAGAVLAHIEASRYDFLVTTYRATARRLEDELSRALPDNPVPSADWSAFVDRCETILSQENANWVAKWGKPQAGGG